MLLETEKLSKHFGSLKAVNDVSLEFNRDQFTAIIGPNGAGKTTFFNMITGNLTPTDGTIRYKDHDITHDDTHEIAERGLARSFQVTNIFPALTVRENVRVGLQKSQEWYNFWRSRSNFSETTERADEILEMIQLSEHGDKPAQDLSHADQRLLEVGLTLSIDPDVVLLDEPTAGMSKDETEHIMDILTEQILPQVELVLMIEHDMDIVMEHSERVIVLHNGSVLVEDDPRTVEENDEVQRVYLGES